MDELSLETIKPEEQRTDFIGRIQEQRQFLTVLHGLLTHQQQWYQLAQESGDDFDWHTVFGTTAPGDDSYANIFLPHGIGGIGKSWLTRRCLTLATDIPNNPAVLTLYDDVSMGAPVLEPINLLDRLYEQLAEAGYQAYLANYWQTKLDVPDIIDFVTRYQFENREQWDKMVRIAADLVSRYDPEPGYHSHAETSIAYTHVSGAEGAGRDSATLAKAYDLLLDQMQEEDKLEPAEAAVFRNPPAALAAHLVTALKQIASQHPLVIGLDNLEIVVPLEPLIRDCLVLPTNHSPIIWILSGRYNLADERIVEINGEQRPHKGYRDLIGTNPPVVWDMSIFGDADLRDYLQAEAERRRAPLLIDDELIEAVKATSSGVPLVVEMVADALFTMDRDEFLRDFALDDKSLLANDRLDTITERFLRYCLTHPTDLERVQAMALLRKEAETDALAAVWNLHQDESVQRELYALRSRYAFVLPEGLHDAVYEFVRRQMRTNWQHNAARERLGRRAVSYYQSHWNELDESFDDQAVRIRNPEWQQATRDLVNALLWAAPDEAVIFLLPRFVEGLGFDRPFSNGLLMQAEEFLAGGVSTFSSTYANLLHRMRVGMQDVEWFFDEPGEAIGAMLESLLQAPGLEPLHLSIIHLWQGNWLVEAGRLDAGLAAYFEADQYRPDDAAGLGRQLSKALYEISSRFFWPESALKTMPSELGLMAARRAVELDPENGGAWFNLGVGLDYSGQETEAITAYERAIDIKPRPMYYNNLGDVYDAVGRTEEAIIAYEQAIELDPTYAWPYHNLGQLFAERGEYEAALDYYQQAINHHQSDKDRAVSWDDFGDANAVLGNYEEAISAYQWAGVLNPRYAPPWYGLGNVYATLERYGEAANAYQRTLLLDPDNAQAHYNLAVMYTRQNDYYRAVAQYRDAIKHHPDVAVQVLAWNGLGDSYVALSQHLDAIQSYQQAIALDPNQADAWNNIGDVHRHLADQQAAMTAYRQAVLLEPDHSTAWNSLGDIYFDFERDDEAIEAYDRVVELEPDFPWPYHNLGVIYSRRDEHNKAKGLYQQAIARHTDDGAKAIAWNHLGDTFIVLDNQADASEAYRQAITLDPNFALPYHHLAEIHQDRAEYEPAIELYQQAIPLHLNDDDRAASWRNLAAIYHTLERHGEASEAYQRVVALDPDDFKSWNNLGDIYLAMARYQEAGQAYHRTIAIEPGFAWPYHSLGLISSDHSAYEEALEQYQQAIERHTSDEDQAVTWTKLADAYQALDNVDEAEKAYTRAMEFDPSYPWPYHSLGLIYQERAEFVPALTLYQQALDHYANGEEKGQAQSWNGLGDAQWALDRPDEAIESYKKAIQLDDIFAAPWNSLGDIYQKQGEHQQAIKSYKEASKLSPADPHPYHNLGLIYETLDEPEPAITCFKQAIDRYPHGAQKQEAVSWNHLGNVHHTLAQDDEAIAAYEQALELNETYVSPWVSLGDIYMAQERYPEAIEAYHEVIDLAPDMAKPWNSLGNIYRTENDYDQAVPAYEQAIKLEPTLAAPYHSLGQINEEQESYPTAIDYYKKALDRYSDEAKEEPALSWNGLGNIYRLQGKDPQAIESYQNSIHLNPDAPWPYYGTGLIHHKLGQYDLAMPVYEQAIDRLVEASDKALVWNDLGNSYVMVQRPNDALDAYEHAIDLDDEYALPWFNLGNVHTSNARFNKAVKAYRQAIKLDADHPWTYNNLGWVRHYQGHPEEAIEHYQKAIELHTDPTQKATTWNYLGDVYQTQQQPNEAIKAYSQAVQLYPTFGRPWNSLGDMYRAVGREEGVVQAYQRAIEYEPAFAPPYHSLGQIFKDRGAYMQAATFYRHAIERHTQDVDRAASWNGLGDVYRLLEQFPQAIEGYQKAIELNPTEAWPYHNLAFIHKNMEQYHQAVPLYQQAIERFNNDRDKAVAWNNLGNVYGFLGHNQDAIEAYKQAINLDDTYALPWNSLGETYAQLDRQNEAIEAYQQAITRNPDYVLAWKNLGDVYKALDRYDEAIRAYQRAIELNKSYPWPYHHLGEIYEEQGDLERAIDHYQQAIDRHESREHKAVLWDNIGSIHRVLGQNDKAIEAFRRSTSLDPGYAAPWYSLGNIYAALDRDQEAIEAYKQAIMASPDKPWPYHSLALVYEKIERYEDAVAFYQQAIDRHTDDRDKAVTWDSLGNVYSDVARYQDAVHAFKQASKLNPDYAVPWNSLGDVYKALNNYPQAVAAYKQAIKLDPNYAWPYNNLGMVYEAMGEYDLAISTLKQVINRHTDNEDKALSWNTLGDVYNTLNREHEAVAAYEEAIRLDPDFTWPYLSLGAIYEKRGQHDQATALYQQATRRHRQRTSL